MIENDNRDPIRFKEFKLGELPDNRCQARVVLAWPDGEEFLGTAQAEDTETGQLWCAAKAATRALEESVDHQIALEVLGVRTIMESDTKIIVALVSYCLLRGMRQKLVGSCISHRQPSRSAALAVLKATNRLMGNVILTRSD